LCLVASLGMHNAAYAQRDTKFQREETHYGIWSRNNFADSIGVSGAGKVIFLSGMGSEDAQTGAILFPDDTYRQCIYAYQKIEKALKAQGARLSDIVKVTTYVTDIRSRAEYSRCRKEVLAAIPAVRLFPHIRS
jgi:2-iminobutanoate/2-iminopropanoate deaminase